MGQSAGSQEFIAGSKHNYSVQFYQQIICQDMLRHHALIVTRAKHCALLLITEYMVSLVILDVTVLLLI